ncbi:TPA: prolyl-tRNA synthetase associated domain-containing protein, partial [Aeromonas dhakensis]|nr:prolyl-tRNA synthetase associated domain-containing protein [Aeromonas dhakensis]
MFAHRLTPLVSQHQEVMVALYSLLDQLAIPYQRIDH